MRFSIHITQVEDGGKVQRLRKTCPDCGPGIFMATMFDRVYWYVDRAIDCEMHALAILLNTLLHSGKCHLTYMYDKSGGKA